VLVSINRIIAGKTSLHRRVRREFVMALVVISAVLIYRTIEPSPGNEGQPKPLTQDDVWSGPAIPGNLATAPQIGAFPIPGIRYLPDKDP